MNGNRFINFLSLKFVHSQLLDETQFCKSWDVLQNIMQDFHLPVWTTQPHPFVGVERLFFSFLGLGFLVQQSSQVLSRYLI